MISLEHEIRTPRSEALRRAVFLAVCLVFAVAALAVTNVAGPMLREAPVAAGQGGDPFADILARIGR